MILMKTPNQSFDQHTANCSSGCDYSDAASKRLISGGQGNVTDLHASFTIPYSGGDFFLCCFLDSILFTNDTERRSSITTVNQTLLCDRVIWLPLSFHPSISPWHNRTGWLGVKHQLTRPSLSIYILILSSGSNRAWNVEQSATHLCRGTVASFHHVEMCYLSGSINPG